MTSESHLNHLFRNKDRHPTHCVVIHASSVDVFPLVSGQGSQVISHAAAAPAIPNPFSCNEASQ